MAVYNYIMDGIKVCSSCHTPKAHALFYREKHRPDGLSLHCKECKRTKLAAYQMRPPRIETPDGMKRCTLCKEVKPAEQFARNKNFHDGLNRTCRACCNARSSLYGKTNRKRLSADQMRRYYANPDRYADYDLKRRFGMTRGQYDEMLAAQGGVCGICRSADPGPRTKRFHVDHNHATGQIRGLLCHHCNHGIGLFGEDTDRIRKAIEYLRHYSR